MEILGKNKSIHEPTGWNRVTPTIVAQMHAQSIQVRFLGLGPRTLILSKTFNLFLPYSSHLETEKIGLIAHVDLFMILHRWFCLSSSSLTHTFMTLFPTPRHLSPPMACLSAFSLISKVTWHSCVLLESLSCFDLDEIGHVLFIPFYFIIYFLELSSFSNVLDFPQSSLQKCQFFPYWVNSFLMLQLSPLNGWRPKSKLEL